MEAHSSFEYLRTESTRILSESVSELKEILSTVNVELTESVQKVAELIFTTFASGQKILIMGNGGSAADAQHFAGEFVSSFSPKVRRRGLPAIAITSNSSVVTAYSNDFDFSGVFARQVEALGKPGDLLIGFSTSGSSENCISGFKTADSIGMKKVALTRTGSPLSKLADFSIEINSMSTQRIQEMHVLIFHVLALLVENAYVIWEDKKE